MLVSGGNDDNRTVEHSTIHGEAEPASPSPTRPTLSGNAGRDMIDSQAD
jgi:hypothetical protein